MLISTRNHARQFTATMWIESVSALAADPDPNTVTLASLIAAGRVFYSPSGLHISNRGTTIFFLDGTNITARLWFYDDVEQLWIPIGQATATAPNTGANTLTTAEVPFAKHYLQITANPGGTTKIAVVIR